MASRSFSLKNKLPTPRLPLPTPQDILILPPLALRSVTSKTGLGVYASSDTLYRGAVFGRDSLEVADDLIRFKPALVRDILCTLARLQGTEVHNDREEEPGKIVHEHRSTIVDKKPINEISQRIFNELSLKWGGDDREMNYYGSVDSTPHFLRVLGTYCELHGDKFLKQKIVRKDGAATTVGECAKAALAWIQHKIISSRSGLVEYKPINPHGITNQVWKDSEEFYVHENGKQANHKAPIASVEVQGLVYDAFTAGAKLFPQQNEEYMSAAIRLRDRTLELLWLEDRRYFAVGLDYKDGDIRIIKTETANPGALLDTGFFDGFEPLDKRPYVEGIVRKVMGKDFLTDAGIRSRSLAGKDLIKFWDYHGTYVSWPKETYDIAKGLRRQGFPKLARQLENRIVNVIMKMREYPEFVYVNDDGHVLTRSQPAHKHGELILIEAPNTPERIQAWTVSAVMAIIEQRLNTPIVLQKPKRKTWQMEIQEEVLKTIPLLSAKINPLALRKRYPNRPYKLFTKK